MLWSRSPICVDHTTGSGVTQSNNGVDASPFILCYNDQIALETQLDYTLPPGSGNGANTTTPGLIYIIYTCPPKPADPNADPCYTGVAWTENLYETNDGSLLGLLEQVLVLSVQIMSYGLFRQLLMMWGPGI